MIKLIHTKFAKEKMRIAMGLPEKLVKPTLDRFDSRRLALPEEEELEDEEEELEDEEEELEDKEEIPQDELLEDNLQEEELAIEEIFDDMDEQLDELELKDEDVLMIPDELPEQIFFGGDLYDETDIISDDIDSIPDETVYDPMESLLDRAKEALKVEAKVEEEVSEDQIMKIELRDRITSFITQSPELAIKLFRVFYNQDITK